MNAPSTQPLGSVPHPLGYAPLLPIAFATTIGILLDRWFSLPLSVWLAVILILGGFWVWGRKRGVEYDLRLIWLGWACLAGGYHHYWRQVDRPQDLAQIAPNEPALVSLRGNLMDEPTRRVHPKGDPLVSRPEMDPTLFLLEAHALEQAGQWYPVVGQVRLKLDGPVADLHSGDQVQVTGWLSRPLKPANPGEWDYSEFLLDQRIHADFHVRKTELGLVRLETRNWSVGNLGRVRAWCQKCLRENVAPEQVNLAGALLLGDNFALSSAEWEKYIRTGVIHVLAISGQHLVILSAFLWFVFIALRIPHRYAVWGVAILILGYSLMTGGRPSAMRAAIMVMVVCGATILSRQALPANSLALAWLVVLGLQPTDLFTAGFQLSFLAVAVLIWGIPRWFPPRELTPIEELIEESRSSLERWVRGLFSLVLRTYRITLILGIALAPLVLYWQQLVSFTGLILGPPLILLTTIALVAGFLLFLSECVGGLFSTPLGWIVSQSLDVADALVRRLDFSGQWLSGCWYVGQVSWVWVLGFYLLGFGLLLRGAPLEKWFRWAKIRSRTWSLALLAWTILGLVAISWPKAGDELRVTFLSVGHGGCTVIETPDGRTLIYDAGTITGPEVTRRQIAPFLWSRGIRRIDELFLSHADLDHFNGVPALLERFAIGKITISSTFLEKPTPGVRLLQTRLEQAQIPIRVTQAGHSFTTGDVAIEVLHPPAEPIPGNENARSLVLLVRHQGHSILLTGDLEKEGAAEVLKLPPIFPDVLMAPHHGSLLANSENIVAWASPRLAVSSQEPTRPTPRNPKPYSQRNIPFWTTAEHGAIILRSHSSGLTAEGFRSQERLIIATGSPGKR